MRRMLRWLVNGIGTLVVLCALLVGWAWLRSGGMIRHRYAVTPASITVPTDSASIARGEHLAHHVTTCSECHGEDLGGAVFADMGPVGVAAGPNLTRGRGGLGATFTDADWVRALRHGVRADSTSLMVMPSEDFVHLTQADLAAIVAYVRALPPVDREVPPSRFGPLGRVLLALGKLPILVAPKTPDVPLADSISTEPEVGYGRYLASIGGCHGCHGLGLSGGAVAGAPPDVPPASNLTPAGRLVGWSEAGFTRTMREGIRPDGTPLDPFMPWRAYAGMTDDELHALWVYLRSVPAKAFGGK